MYKAIHSFTHENPKMLSIKPGDSFVLLREIENGWWLVQAADGSIGLVPANYIEPNDAHMNEVVEFIDKALKLAPFKHQPFSTDYIPLSKKVLEKLKQLHIDHHHLKNNERNLPKLNRKAPPVPPRFSPSPTSPSMQKDSEIKINSNYLNTPQISPNLFWILVTKTRELTNISFEASKNAVISLLTSLADGAPDISQVIKFVLEQGNIGHDFFENKNKKLENFLDQQNHYKLTEILMESQDAVDLKIIIKKVDEAKDDGQQRSWSLYEDLQSNTLMFQKLLNIVMNANPLISKKIFSSDHFYPCYSLVQYYQMESREPIRLIMLQVLTKICHLDVQFIEELLSSVLPLELAREIKDSIIGENEEKLKLLLGLLSILFSTGQPIPLHHYNIFDLSFFIKILETMENSEKTSELVSELLVKFFISFNQHFALEENICLKAIKKVISMTTPLTLQFLTQYLVLAFNREDEPVKTSFLKYSSQSNSVTKILIDIFSDKSTSNIFYTNDSKVLLDVIIRQLNDLPSGDYMRTENLTLLQLFLTNSNYFEHFHRVKDMRDSLNKISKEEDDFNSQRIAIDKQIVEEILEKFSNQLNVSF